MSYEKHTWIDGELVTAAKMNNIENGIEEASSGGGSGGDDTMYVRFTNSGGTWSADHTIAQIAEAIDEGKIVLGIYPNSGESVCCARKASTWGSNYNISFSFVGYGSGANSNRLYVDRVSMSSETGNTTASTYYVALTQ
jgi:hypothetical protein